MKDDDDGERETLEKEWWIGDERFEYTKPWIDWVWDGCWAGLSLVAALAVLSVRLPVLWIVPLIAIGCCCSGFGELGLNPGSLSELIEMIWW